jgi:hypothetical protein
MKIACSLEIVKCLWSVERKEKEKEKEKSNSWTNCQKFFSLLSITTHNWDTAITSECKKKIAKTKNSNS